MKRLSLFSAAALAILSVGISAAAAADLDRQNWKDPMHNVQSPRADDAALETEIAAKASVAPRVTLADVKGAIRSEHYFTAGDGSNGAAWLEGMDDSTGAIYALDAVPAPRELHLLTFCVLVLKNGFTVTGESACASPENFNEEIGRKVARANAVNKVWPLLGFRLRDELQRSAAA